MSVGRMRVVVCAERAGHLVPRSVHGVRAAAVVVFSRHQGREEGGEHEPVHHHSVRARRSSFGDLWVGRLLDTLVRHPVACGRTCWGRKKGHSAGQVEPKNGFTLTGTTNIFALPSALLRSEDHQGHRLQDARLCSLSMVHPSFPAGALVCRPVDGWSCDDRWFPRP